MPKRYTLLPIHPWLGRDTGRSSMRLQAAVHRVFEHHWSGFFHQQSYTGLIYQLRWNIENGPVCPVRGWSHDWCESCGGCWFRSGSLQFASYPVKRKRQYKRNMECCQRTIRLYSNVSISPNTAIVSGLSAAGTNSSIYTFRYWLMQ